MSCGLHARPSRSAPGPARDAPHVAAPYDVTFAGFSLLWYRDGDDCQAFHRDRDMRYTEDTLVGDPDVRCAAAVVAPPPGPQGQVDRAARRRRHDLSPAGGDLFVLGGRAQADWEHSVPKIPGATRPLRPHLGAVALDVPPRPPRARRLLPSPPQLHPPLDPAVGDEGVGPTPEASEAVNRACRRCAAGGLGVIVAGMQTIGDLGTILSIWAHPDDETYLSGAVMAAAAANGQRVVLVHATRGEQGTDDPQLAGARLGALRTVEMARARAALGVSEQWFFDFPDGGCADVPLDDALRKLMPIVASVQPDTILTFGPDGITGHPDHCTVSDWATHAWTRYARPDAPAVRDVDARARDRVRSPQRRSSASIRPAFR